MSYISKDILSSGTTLVRTVATIACSHLLMTLKGLRVFAPEQWLVSAYCDEVAEMAGFEN